MTRRQLFAWLLLVAVLGAGCGVRPSGVITGGPAPTAVAIGRPGAPAPDSTVLYFLADSSLTPVLRQLRKHPSAKEVLVLLQSGPDAGERAEHLTSEVPIGLDPVTVATDASGNVDVVVSADVTTLSARAVDQIVCTVGDALSATAPITLTSPGATRGPQTCPLAG